MLKAKLCFGMCSMLILLIGSLTPDLSAQTLNSPQYNFSDGLLPTVSSANPMYSNIGSSSQGCGMYGSCATSGCQNETSTQTCSDGNCASQCGCGRCGRNGAVAAQFQAARQVRSEYFQIPPAPSCPGDRLYQLIGAQRTNAQLAQLVFYNFHFRIDDATRNLTLSPAGVGNVHKVARIWPRTPGTITVEPSGDPNSDQVRLQIVQQAMATSGIQADVALGNPTAYGLSGIEAMNIYEQRILNAPLASSSQSSAGSGVASGASAGGN